MGHVKIGCWLELAYGLDHSDFLMWGSKLSCGHKSSHFTWASTTSRMTAMNLKRESQRHQSDNSSSTYIQKLYAAYEC